MNTVQLVGKIATDIRLDQFGQTGTDTAKTKASFLLAVGRPVRNADPDWIRVETWGKQAQNLVRFNGKGSRIAVSGRLRGQFYNPDGGDRGGQLRTIVVAEEIQFLGAPKLDGTTSAAAVAVPTEPARTSRR